MTPRSRSPLGFLVSQSFSTRESIAESPSRNALGTLTTQPGLPPELRGAEVATSRPRAGPTARDPRVPARAFPLPGDTWARPRRVLGDRAAWVLSQRGSSEPCRDLPLLDFQGRRETRCVNGCRVGAGVGAGAPCRPAGTSSASYSALSFSDFG